MRVTMLGEKLFWHIPQQWGDEGWVVREVVLSGGVGGGMKPTYPAQTETLVDLYISKLQSSLHPSKRALRTIYSMAKMIRE